MAGNLRDWLASLGLEHLTMLEQAWALFDPSRDAKSAFSYGQDSGVSVKSLGFEVVAHYDVCEREMGLAAINFACPVVSIWRHRKWES